MRIVDAHEDIAWNALVLGRDVRRSALKTRRLEQDTSFLLYLENQREELKKAVLEAPKHRLDNLATFVETHSERLSHFLEALLSYRRKRYWYRLKSMLVGLLCSLLGSAAAVGLLVYAGGLMSATDSSLLVSGVAGLTAAFSCCG